MAVYLVRHYILTLAILKQVKKREADVASLNSKYEPTVSFLIPACNEEKVIAGLLQRITELTYPKDKIQVIVIDDASSDKTRLIAEAYASRYPFIEVLHRNENDGGIGKAAAINAGFKLVTGEITLCFDADYYPQEDIVEKLVRPFEDPTVGGVQGRVVVLNEPENMWTRLVALERIGGYRVDQKARNSLGLITQFGGTVGGFRSCLLEKLGGWDESVLAEDTDLTFRVYFAGYHVAYVVDAECYEEAVNNWGAYWKQRHRWARGHMQCCFKHSVNLLRSKHLSRVAKFDGLLLLNVYFMPLIVLLSVAVGVPLIWFNLSQIAEVLWFSVPVALYSFVGNFAPFFEVGIGAHLDGRKRIQWLIPLLIFAFLYNIPICLKAFLDLLGSKIMGKKRQPWAKTQHLGSGNRSVVNSSIVLERS